MASHTLIDNQIADLRRRLPAEAVDELADGLALTFEHHLRRGLHPAAAAEAAIAEFGDTAQITTAFTRQAPGRRTALALLATGPAVGACWGASLGLGRAWTWHIPAHVVVAFGLTLLAVLAALAAAATSRRNYRRTRLAAAGAAGLIALDTLMVTAALTAAPILVWPMALAIPASLVRTGLTVRSMPRMLTR
jgi:hypothetical protein